MSNRNPSCSIGDVRPPTRGFRSMTVVFKPEWAKSIAAASPPGPAPIIATSVFIKCQHSVQTLIFHKIANRSLPSDRLLPTSFLTEASQSAKSTLLHLRRLQPSNHLKPQRKKGAPEAPYFSLDDVLRIQLMP